MHNPESAMQNETYNLPRDFEIQREYLISATPPDFTIINKKR